MTAKEFYNKWNLENYFQSSNENQLLELMNDYAKYHVEKALSEASKKATIDFSNKEANDYGINVNSILKSYPLTEIK